MPATSACRPAKSAISSMHSIVISVESMSMASLKSPSYRAHEAPVELRPRAMGGHGFMRRRIGIGDSKGAFRNAFDRIAAGKTVERLQVGRRDIVTLDEQVHHASFLRNWRTSEARALRSSCFISIFTRSGPGRR